MGNNVRLVGLSDREKDLLDTMWSFNKATEFQAWFSLIEKDEQILVQRLLDRLILEVAVEVNGLDEVKDTSEAKHLLMKFM